ncbi:hypothetical protein NMG60_11031653 [Bertholletia excelsa]
MVTLNNNDRAPPELPVQPLAGEDLPNPRTPPAPVLNYPEASQNQSAANFVKQLVFDENVPNSSSYELPPLSPPLHPSHPEVSGNVKGVVDSGDRKRKRGPKPKAKVPDYGGQIKLEIVNKNGVAVDFRALEESGDELYAAELRRRTVGLETERAILGFLSDLEGEWGSRRKKRKMVDACEFGDSLPVGWKLLLGLKKSEGRVSITCRRYISPGGQQFLSCREASLHLQSHFGITDLSQALDHPRDDIELGAGFIHRHNNAKQHTLPNSTSPILSTVNVNETGFGIMGIDNIQEVEIQYLLECRKCNTSFNDKSKYLKHTLSCHPKVVRRYEFGASIGGFVVKDINCEQVPGQPTVQKSAELPDMSMDMANDGLREEEDSKSLLNGNSEPHILKSAGKHQFRTMCIWCAKEFAHKIVDPEAYSDAVGFICPACKVKISGAVNRLVNSPSPIK